MSNEHNDAVAQLASILRTSEEILPLGEEGRASTESLAKQLEVSHSKTTGIRWGWTADEIPEMWIGAYATREQAIEDARAHSWKTFHIASGTCPNPKAYMPTAETIESMLSEAARDAAGEAVEDFPGLSLEAIDEMNVFFNAWANRHLKACNFWIADAKTIEKIEEAK